jgi:cell division protein FtsW
VKRGDHWLVALPLVLAGTGLIMVYSAGSILSVMRSGDPDHFLFAHGLRVLLGVLAMVGVARLPLRWLERFAPWLLGVAAVLLVAVVVTGRLAKGAQRWLTLGGISIQPTDLARLAAVVFLAWWLKRHPPAERGFWRGTALPLGIVGMVAALILVQPNLSSAALLGATGFVMLFLAGAPFLHLALPVAAGLTAVAATLATHPYQMERVRTFAGFLFTGELDARGAGFQLDQSLVAIGSGGWFGRGLGAGLQKYGFLPEAHTDFIFSILAEELGFLGATALIVAFALLLWRGMRTAARASDPFTCLLAGGLTVQIGLYALANLAVATGLAPTTGLPLPYVSYGGSALLANLMAAGLLFRISAANGAHEALARQRWSREAR